MESVQNRAETEHPRAEQQHDKTSKKKKLNNESSTAPAAAPALSPPSASSSPSHEFSFTISLHPSNPNAGGLPGRGPVIDRNPGAAKAPNNPFAIDLSPADDIFFHGHLLPLHLLSHLPPSAASPRSSTNSLDSFTLPIKDLILDEQKNRPPEREREIRRSPRRRPTASSKSDSKIARKSKSFTLFGMPRWRKVVTEVRGREDVSPSPNKSQTKKKQSKKNPVLDDFSQLMKRYIRMVRPLLFQKRNNRGMDEDRDQEDSIELDFGSQQRGSFSGNLSARRTNKNDFPVKNCRGSSDLFSSAPASMSTSPTNSGLLVPKPTGPLRSNDSSTMEELQAAIQAAIAHCKNSIAAAEEGKAVKV